MAGFDFVSYICWLPFSFIFGIWMIVIIILIIQYFARKQNIIKPTSEFYEKVKNEAIIGMIEGAFTYTTGKGGARTSACDILVTQNYVLQVHKPELNAVPGIFGFATTDTFKNNIDKSKVILGNMNTVSGYSPDPKSISEAVPLEKIEIVSLVFWTFSTGQLFDDYKVDVSMMHLRMGGKFLGVQENILFTKSEFENVVNLINRTPLSTKLQVSRETVTSLSENLK